MFKLLQKGNKIKLFEPRRPEKVGKTDDPNYCLYHRMLGHSTHKCFILKDMLQVLVDVQVLRLEPEERRVTNNAVSLQFRHDLPPVPCRVVLVPKGEVRVVNDDPHNQQRV